jgi:phospholipid-binding lipoprotein MlaA
MSGLVTFADLVDEIDELRASSVDFYGAMRSLYRQKRAADIANGESQENIPDFDIQPAPPGPARP